MEWRLLNNFGKVAKELEKQCDMKGKYVKSVDMQGEYVKLLYADSWPSRQSEILGTGRTCENKRKHSCSGTEAYGCDEMMHAYAFFRYGSMWVGLSLQLLECQWVSRRIARAASHWASYSKPLVEYLPTEKQKKC